MTNKRTQRTPKNLAIGDKVKVSVAIFPNNDDEVQTVKCTGTIVGLLQYKKQYKYEDNIFPFYEEAMHKSKFVVYVKLALDKLKVKIEDYPDVQVYMSEDIKLITKCK